MRDPESAPKSRGWAQAQWHGGIVCCVAGAVMLAALAAPASVTRAAVLLIASGVPIAFALRHQYSLGEFFAVALGASSFVTTIAGLSWLVFGSAVGQGAWLLPVFALAMAWVLREHRLQIRATQADLGAAVIAVVGAAFVAMFYAANGPFSNPQGLGYRMRSWVARDSCYLFAITQQILERRSIPSENPFGAGLPLCYAWAGHCGLALLADRSGQPAAFALWHLGPVYHISAILLIYYFALSRSHKFNDVSGVAAAALGTTGVCAWRPDFFVYPQSQSFFLNMLALVLWAGGRRGAWRRGWSFGVLASAALLLAAVHTVSATVAAALVAGIFCDRVASPRGRNDRHSWIWLGLLACLGLSIWWWGHTPFRATRGLPTSQSFSQLRTYFLPFAFLYGVAILSAWGAFRQRRQELGWAMGLLVGLALAYTGLGLFCLDPFSQFFAIFNAQRFVYFATVLALPILCGWPNLARWSALGLLNVWPLLLPPGVVRDVTQLLTAKPLEYTPADLKAYAWIRGRTPPTARFMTNAQHWGLPAFTGRSEFVQGPVMLFGLHSVPESVAPQLFRLREEFWGSMSPELRAELLRRWHLEFILVEKTIASKGRVDQKNVPRQLLEEIGAKCLYESERMAIYQARSDHESQSQSGPQ